MLMQLALCFELLQCTHKKRRNKNIQQLFQKTENKIAMGEKH